MLELERLELQRNQLSGVIPARISALDKMAVLYLHLNPGLKCWETQEALDWANGLYEYQGPQGACNFVSFVNLPLVVAASD
jgi:hypothetical protein